MEVKTKNIGYISISPGGDWVVHYGSYASGELKPEMLVGQQLAPLMKAIENNKNKYLLEF